MVQESDDLAKDRGRTMVGVIEMKHCLGIRRSKVEICHRMMAERNIVRKMVRGHTDVGID